MRQINFIIQNDLLKYENIFKQYGSNSLTIKKGSLLSEQCRTNTLFYLEEGIAKVFNMYSDGKERVIDFMKKGTLVAMDCVIPGSRAVVSISAVIELKVIPIPDYSLKQMIADYPEFGYDLVLFYSKILRQVCYISSLTYIADRNGRLANFLLLFVDSAETDEDIKISMTQDEIASAVCMSRAHVALKLAELRSKGIIETKNRYILLKNPKAIADMINSPDKI